MSLVPAVLLPAFVILTCASTALADGLSPGTPVSWRDWNWDWLVFLNLCLLAWFYLVGLRRLWSRRLWRSRVRPLHAVAYYTSLVVVFLSLLTPLDALSSQSFAAHMTQHMLLAMVAAPLFIIGAPTVVLACGVPRQLRELTSVGPFWSRLFWNPAFVWFLFAIVLWGWHFPVVYQAALRDALVHDAQHLSIFIVSAFFWRMSLDPLSHKRLEPPVAVLYLFTTALHASALGVLICFSPQPWYDEYAMSSLATGLTPLADQQLAGLIMWIPSCLVYPVVAVGVFGIWLARAGSADHSQQVTIWNHPKPLTPA